MKKILILSILWILPSLVHAEMEKDVFGFSINAPKASEAVGYSSSTCAGTPTFGSTVISTVASSELYAIEITSPSLGYFQVFDASGAFVAVASPGSTTTARIVDGYVAATPVRTVWYQTQTAFGILINVVGSPTPCLGIRYSSK